MESTEVFETSAELKRTPGMYPKERIQYLKPDESLKSSQIFIHVSWVLGTVEGGPGIHERVDGEMIRKIINEM